MRGGNIRIEGSTGNYLGEHMCGGTITLDGNGGDFPGVSNRGGTIIMGGSVYLSDVDMLSGPIVSSGAKQEFFLHTNTKGWLTFRA